jgi:hypothetical protein
MLSEQLCCFVVHKPRDEGRHAFAVERYLVDYGW